VSVGNTADLTPNDLLLYWDQEPGTDLILAYLESVPGPRRFARRISRHTPLVVVKAGRTGAGRRAASRIPLRWRPGRRQPRHYSTRRR
jgi:acyl-CoA synthetase (NDP forming)